ncbi:MAG: hypothetical protein QOI94_210 [Acidobacteriaceae bacterium]|jgi:hypothetical protein|nr:hypothetical protein [Acidobacteriaceae bacterium]
MLLVERVGFILASKSISTDDEVRTRKRGPFQDDLGGAGASGEKGRESRCP